MSSFELVQLLIAFQNRLDVQWGVFITVHLALFGGIIYIDRPLRVGEKLAAMVIYSGFAAINYLVSINLSLSIEAVQEEISNMANQACCDHSALIQRISAEYQSGGAVIAQRVLQVSHAAMCLLVLLSILLDRRLIESAPAQSAD